VAQVVPDERRLLAEQPEQQARDDRVGGREQEGTCEQGQEKCVLRDVVAVTGREETFVSNPAIQAPVVLRDIGSVPG
jgi:hypothetical protein